MTDLFSLAGRRVLVTGGTRGIGRAITMQLARSGASVIANYARNTEAADDVAASASAENLSVTTCRGDVTSQKGLDAICEALGGDDAPLSLVHCAATGVHRPLEQLTARYFDWTFALNARAFVDLVRVLLPALREGSSVVAVSSEGAVRAVPQYTLVGASKGALESLARHLAAELAPRGIRVNIVSPGSVVTQAWDALPDKDARLAAAAARSPLGRLTSVEEVASATHFLLSDAAAGIVGHTLVVDGGKRIVE